MGITAIDHIYVETHDWDAAVAFWEGLGFMFESRWGEEGHRAGRLTVGDAAVVLAEVAPDKEPELTVFFALEDAEELTMGDGVEVVTPLSDTHWGTRWIRVRDPESRIHALEAHSEE